MQRMFNLRKWTEVREGSALSFHSERARIVKFELNSPGEVLLHIRYPNAIMRSDDAGHSFELVPAGATFFLGLVKGREALETFVEGQFDLLVEGGTVYVFTADGDDVHAVVVEPVIFTRIAERRARNPELEAIERRMYLNQERRLAAQMEDMDRRYGALLTAAEEKARHAEVRATAAKQRNTNDSPEGHVDEGGGEPVVAGGIKDGGKLPSSDQADGKKRSASDAAKQGTGNKP